MLEIEKRAQKDTNPFFGLFAAMTASSAQDVYEAIKDIRERRLFGYQFSLPDLPAWFALYRRPLKALLVSSEYISEFSEAGKDIVALVFAFRKLQKMAKNTPEKLAEIQFTSQDLKEGQDFFNEMRSKLFTEVQEDINDTPFDHQTGIKFRKYLADHELELGFCYLVYIPCIYLYKTFPTDLYQKALNGDVNSLERLVKLDPIMLHDPAIGQKIQALRFKNMNGYEKIIDAAKKPLRYNQKEIKSARKKMKVESAAMIASFAEGIKKPITNQQIRAPFDAYAKDSQGKLGYLEDADLPKSPEALDKALKRHKPDWQKMFQNLDKKK